MSDRFVRKLRHGAALSAEDEGVLSRMAEPIQRVGARQDIMREGEQAHSLTLILQGWACRYRDLPDGRRQIIAFFLPGDLCEPFGILPEFLDYSLGTITPVEFVLVPSSTILSATRASSSIERALWWDLLVASSLLHERAVSLGRRTALERLGHLFCELHARLDLVGLADRSGFVLPVTQRDLADALGISDVHLNRSLQALRATGLITLSDRYLMIHDLIGLQHAALFDAAFLHLRLAAKD